MTFQAGGDPTNSGSGAGAGTSFVAPGAADQGGGTSEDTQVVLEHNGRKFTKTDLLKKIDNADQFIGQLKSENAENRKALDAATAAIKEQINAVEILKKIKEGQQAPAEGGQQSQAQAQAPLSVDEIVNQVQARQQAAATESQRNANWTEVTTTLTKAFGNATDQKVAQVAAEKGLTLEQAKDMARATPKAFLALFPDLSKRPGPSPLPTSGTVNSQAFNGTRDGKSSGYSKANGTKELVSIYQSRLAELGL